MFFDRTGTLIFGEAIACRVNAALLTAFLPQLLCNHLDGVGTGDHPLKGGGGIDHRGPDLFTLVSKSNLPCAN